MKRLAWLGVPMAIWWVACGGDVVVDRGSGGSGANGQGASTGSDPSSSAGPSCSCTQACTILETCGANVDCSALCASNPPTSVIQCVCQNASSCNFEPCIPGSDQSVGPGTGTTSGGTESGASVSSGSGTGGGFDGPSQECVDCTNEVANQECQELTDKCSSEDACRSLLECNGGCGWTQSCWQNCAPQAPSFAIDLVEQMLSCFVCSDCVEPCQSFWFTNQQCVLD